MRDKKLFLVILLLNLLSIVVVGVKGQLPVEEQEVQPQAMGVTLKWHATSPTIERNAQIAAIASSLPTAYSSG